jgi:type I restriction-modification system DNA methylase subunit
MASGRDWHHRLPKTRNLKVRIPMISDHLTDIAQFDADLWKVADELRANSGLASNEYFMPIMGLLFLRQATNRYYEAVKAISADQGVIVKSGV